MKIFNAKRNMMISFDGDQIAVTVIFDFVDGAVYVDHVMHDDVDIKSMIDSSLEKYIDDSIIKYLKNTGQC